MINLGQFNTLSVIKASPAGAILDGGQFGNILLTAQHQRFMAGDKVSAFIYLDSEGELAATQEKPLVEMGQVALLKIVDVTEIGAFADWGLPKDLFIPFAEQHHKLLKDRSALVKVYLDNQNRITGTTRIDHVIKDESPNLKEGEKVSIIVADKTELGYKAIINHQSWGLLYDNELPQPLKKGKVLTAYIRKIRDDKKVDLSLRPTSYNQEYSDDLSRQIMQKLEANDGYILFNDKSSPEAIQREFGVSKKAFKKSCGALYKGRKIVFEGAGIRLTEA